MCVFTLFHILNTKHAALTKILLVTNAIYFANADEDPPMEPLNLPEADRKPTDGNQEFYPGYEAAPYPSPYSNSSLNEDYPYSNGNV